MVSKTVGAWVSDGVTDQTISAIQVSMAKKRFAMSVVLIIDPLLCAVETRLGREDTDRCTVLQEATFLWPSHRKATVRVCCSIGLDGLTAAVLCMVCVRTASGYFIRVIDRRNGPGLKDG